MSHSLFTPRWLACARMAAAAGLAALLVAGCNGGGDDAPDGADGAASEQVPVVTPPGVGGCCQAGADATPNSKLDCAP
ncbi:hypothetical protein ACOTIX_22915 [Achromobacter xylosoxidans]|jgi:hypothetical protein